MNRNYIERLKFYLGNTKGELDVPLVKKQKTKKQYVTYQVKRFKDNGYNPIHIFGTWYWVRHKSKNYTKISYYKPFNVAKHYREQE